MNWIACLALVALQQSDWQIVDVAEQSGLDFRHSFGDDQFSKILEDTGSGVALIDYDGDGLLDVFLSSGHWVEGVSDPAFKDKTSGARSRLFRNLGALQFRDVTDEVGISEHGFGMGAVVGDYDGDGDEDLLVLNWGPNVLYRNDTMTMDHGIRVNHFVDVTAAAGVAGPEKLNGERKWSVNGLFFDYDQDGDLDFYVANYLAFDPAFHDPNLPKEYPYEGPDSYRGQQSMLYRNNGDGTFTDATKEAGLENVNGKTMGAVACDFDEDGDLDLFEAQDSMPNVLWRNQGGKFVEVGAEAGVAFDASGAAMASMHGSVGDVDGDGRFDLFVPDLANGCLYRNQTLRIEEILPDLPPATSPENRALRERSLRQFEESREERGPRFTDEAKSAGLAAVLQGSGAWGSTFQDFDLDGDVDLLVVLGGAFDLGAAQHDRLFLNDGNIHDMSFREVSKKLGSSFLLPHVSRGAAFGDLDNDGDVDYVVNVKDVGAPPRVMRNDLPRVDPGITSGWPHWLTVKLVGAGRNRDAIGARVALTVLGRTQWRQVSRADSYLSQCDVRLHFGLGGATKIDGMMIVWPSGKRQEIAAAQIEGVDRAIVVKEESKP